MTTSKIPDKKTILGTKAPSDLQLSRVQQAWLMLALVVSAVPLWLWLPFWVPLFTLMGIGWRAAMLWRGSIKPSKVMLALLAISSIAANLFTFWPHFGGLEPMTALLLTGSCLKYLEMRRNRDARLLVFLCYFVTGIQLIFAAEIYAFIVAVFSIVITLSAQNILQRSPNQQYSISGFSVKPLTSAGRLVLFSVPLMLCIFIFAPRLPSFWVVPTKQGQPKTGVSESMSPGTIGNLAKSDELAFRVSFKNEVPSKAQMYWRGIVMSDFDGQTWRNTAIKPDRPGDDRFPSLNEVFTTYWPDRGVQKTWQSEIDYGQRTYAYDVFIEPTQQRWLFALAAPQTSSSNLGMTQDLRLINRDLVTSRGKYQVVSHPDYRFQAQGLDARTELRNLSLPDEYNPKALALGKEWSEAGLSADRVVGEIFSLFNRQFTYTLEPGTYGVDGVDEFLFERQRGFCEHFASATVILLRAAGIPARVVTGYQGGETSPYDDYILVHQYDAHAWAEYWQPDTGWQRIDPTNAVAPQRIERGARDSYASERGFLADSPLSLNRLQGIGWADWVRLRLDSVEYLWARWVLGYDDDQQTSFLESVFGKWNIEKLALVLSSAALIGLLCVGLYFRITIPQAKASDIERRFRIFTGLCEALGIKVTPATTPAQLAEIAADLSDQYMAPDLKSNITALCKLFERRLYADESVDGEIKRLLMSVKRKKLTHRRPAAA